MRYEYRVIEVREQLSGGVNGQKLQELLNENAAQGWQLKAITSADVKGRVTREVQGLLVTFERVVQLDRLGRLPSCRGPDSNRRPSDYEPETLPNCATPDRVRPGPSVSRTGGPDGINHTRDG